MADLASAVRRDGAAERLNEPTLAGFRKRYRHFLRPASLRIPDGVLANRPALRAYVGKPVIADIRPEDIEDAALLASPHGAAFDVKKPR